MARKPASPKLAPEYEVIAAYATTMTAAFQVLVLTLQNNGALVPGQYPEALREYMELSKNKASPVTLALLDDLRKALLT
jgi:hypothetical protein